MGLILMPFEALSFLSIEFGGLGILILVALILVSSYLFTKFPGFAKHHHLRNLLVTLTSVFSFYILLILITPSFARNLVLDNYVFSLMVLVVIIYTLLELLRKFHFTDFLSRRTLILLSVLNTVVAGIKLLTYFLVNGNYFSAYFAGIEVHFILYLLMNAIFILISTFMGIRIFKKDLSLINRYVLLFLSMMLIIMLSTQSRWVFVEYLLSK